MHSTTPKSSSSDLIPSPSSTIRRTSYASPTDVKFRRPLSETEKLARENARMEERLNALRLQLNVQKQKYRSLRRVSSANTSTDSTLSHENSIAKGESGSIWSRGGKGTLSSHAQSVLDAKRKFLNCRSLDAVEYLGTIPIVSSVSKSNEQLAKSVTSYYKVSNNRTPLPINKPLTQTLLKPFISSSPTPPLSSSRSSLSKSHRPTWNTSITQISSIDANLIQDDKEINEVTEIEDDDQTKVLISSLETCESSLTWKLPTGLNQLNQDSGYDINDIKQLYSPINNTNNRFQLDEENTNYPTRLTSLQSIYQFDLNGGDVTDINEQEKNISTSLPNNNTDSTHKNKNKNNWGEGTYDEQSNRSEFKSAVEQWRKQALPIESNYIIHTTTTTTTTTTNKIERPATTATCSIETTTSELWNEWNEQVQFTPGMSLMERMLLRKLRETNTTT